MTILIQDSHFGRLLRYASRGRLLPSTEDQDPALVKRFSLDASSADVDSATSHNLSTDEQTAEKGGNGKKDDGHIVGWYGSDDPEVSFTQIQYYTSVQGIPRTDRMLTF